jgi:hypothetical protein
VRAELIIGHNVVDSERLAQLLESVFGVKDASALDRSPMLASGGTQWRTLVLFAAESAAYRIVCFATTTTSLQAIVEPTLGDFQHSCQTVLDGIRRALDGHKPKLQSAEIIDPVSGRSVFRAKVGFPTEIRQRQAWQPIALGVVTLLVVGVGVLTFAKSSGQALAIGAIPAFVAAALAVVLLIIDSAGKRIHWED